MVRPHDRLRPDRIDDPDHDIRVLAQNRQEIARRDLDHVDFAGGERLGRRRSLRDVHPLDAIDLRDLAAGEAARRLVAGNVERVLLVDDLTARDPLLLDEDEGAGADRFGDLRIGIDQPFLLAQDEERILGRRQGQQHWPKRPLQPDLEALPAGRDDRVGEQHHGLTRRNAGRPALDRGHGVLRLDRRAVAEFEPVAQLERPHQIVRADGIGIDHLRLRRQRRVEREQHVVDHVAVVAGDVRRREERVEDLEIGLWHEAQHRVSARRNGAGRERREAQAQHGQASAPNLESNSTCLSLPPKAFASFARILAPSRLGIQENCSAEPCPRHATSAAQPRGARRSTAAEAVQ